MKKLALALLICFVCGIADAGSITVNYSDDRIAEHLDNFLYVHENSKMVDNPAYVPPEIEDPENPGEMIPNPEYVGEPEEIKKYTDKGFIKHKIKEYFIGQIKRGINAKRRDTPIEYDTSDIE